MLHCYCFIHDDMPCMNNDDFQRSRPATTTVWRGDGVADRRCPVTTAFGSLTQRKCCQSRSRRPMQLLIRTDSDLGCSTNDKHFTGQLPPADRTSLALHALEDRRFDHGSGAGLRCRGRYHQMQLPSPLVPCRDELNCSRSRRYSGLIASRRKKNSDRGQRCRPPLSRCVYDTCRCAREGCRHSRLAAAG